MANSFGKKSDQKKYKIVKITMYIAFFKKKIEHVLE